MRYQLTLTLTNGRTRTLLFDTYQAATKRVFATSNVVSWTLIDTRDGTLIAEVSYPLA